tara:strand:+ start:25602 stop:29135 length:3534 start_codon:yes stop_codon:yes gene_type:complete
MHNSGTSALTKSLELFGIGVGNELSPPERDNPAGLFEDKGCLEINEQLLTRLGHQQDFLTFNPDQLDLDAPEISRLKQKAAEIVQNRIAQSAGHWGFKDPRTCRLLPFWKAVFTQVGCMTRYIVVVRNPLSVAVSLARRNHTPPEIAHLLWAQHVIPAISETTGAERILVDYDSLVANPMQQMRRISQKLNLVMFDEKAPEVPEYISRFLDLDRRNIVPTIEDIRANSKLPQWIAELYVDLERVAADRLDIDNVAADSAFNMARASLEIIEPFAGYAAGLKANIANLTQQLDQLHQESLASDGSLQKQLMTATRQLADYGDQTAALAKSKADLEEALKQCAAEKQAILDSTSWRMTAVFRGVSRLIGRGGRDHQTAFRNGQPILQVPAKPPQHPDALPADFNPAIYCLLNPDIENYPAGPSDHYLQHGRMEGRVYSLPGMSANQKFDAAKRKCLVVTHQASLTGAPVLSYNLVKSLSDEFDVITLTLGGGPLLEHFSAISAWTICEASIYANPRLPGLILDVILSECEIDFAIVNSIESRPMLEQIVVKGIPTVSLIHEFAAYTRPEAAFRHALQWSHRPVFSTLLTYENMRARNPDLAPTPISILPQGRCQVPERDGNVPLSDSRSESIADKFKKKGDEILIIGAGAVQLRKGVDLFVDCASRIARQIGGARCRFVWVGMGYNPQEDMAYSVYIEDQVKRAGIENVLTFLPETPEIEEIYAAGDIFLLSSRLDPLPNVAIDAMTHAIPLVCFDKTTGIVEFLRGAGLAEQCVAGYLDCNDAALKVGALAQSEDLRRKIGAQCREIATKAFDWSAYVDQLRIRVEEAKAQAATEMENVDVIDASKEFHQEFAVPPHDRKPTQRHEILAYVRSWAMEVSQRKPCPGFHPGVYWEINQLRPEDGDPFAHYIRAGKPQGGWNNLVINASTPYTNIGNDAKVALHIHAYYPNLLEEIVSRLQRNQIRPDLFVSVPSETAEEEALRCLSAYSGEVAKITITPNRGRDIGPFITAFGADLVEAYDYIGHIHTKKSATFLGSETADDWRNLNFENLLGGAFSGAMMDRLLSVMDQSRSLQMVIPEDPNIVGWQSSLAPAKPIARKLGLSALPKYFLFPVGTMFWAKSGLIAPLLNLDLNWHDYPDEPLPYDGTMLHAMERLIGLLAANGPAGALATTHTPEVKR